jgi:hypothetical protein
VSRRGPTILFAAVLTLVAGAAVVVVDGAGVDPRDVERGRAFQSAVGGLGFGPALDLSGSERAFDPRVGNVPSARHHPLPGGDAFVTPD